MTLGVAACAVPLNVVFGLAASWTIAKFKFKGRSLLIALIDLPFSVSPVVAGLIFVLMFGRGGWFGSWAMRQQWAYPSPLWRGFTSHVWPFGYEMVHFTGIIFTPLAMVIATVFITFPFVARNLIPLMEVQGSDEELAAATLGAGGFQTFRKVTLPNIKWGLLYGVILCNARAMGEFGAVSVVGGQFDSTSTIPLRVENLYQGGNISGAFAVGSILAMLAVVTLIFKSVLEWKQRRDLVLAGGGMNHGRGFCPYLRLCPLHYISSNGGAYMLRSNFYRSILRVFGACTACCTWGGQQRLSRSRSRRPGR